MQKISEVDILALAAHPDDVELACSGTLIRAVEQGMKVGICDMTRGELGTRGNPDLRLVEAEKARSIIGADFRVKSELTSSLGNCCRDLHCGSEYQLCGDHDCRTYGCLITPRFP